MTYRKYVYLIIFIGSILYLYFLKYNYEILSKYHPSMELMRKQKYEFEYLSEELCNFEPFVYKHTVVDEKNNTKVISGKKFDCAKGFPLLQKYKLLSNFRIPEISINPKSIVFVIAGGFNYYPLARAVIASIKENFGEEFRIIYYDIQGTLENKNFTDEMKGICNFEARTFNWSILPENVINIEIFSWKVLIIAELFKEFETFWYLDSSIFFQSGDFQPFYDLINGKIITPFQMSGNTGQSIRHATNHGMYKYIPLDLTIPKKHAMLEANMMLFHRNDATRKIIKWSVLCAITRECIQPPVPVGEIESRCIPENDTTPEGSCHRQDQSLFNILLANLEQQWINEGRPIITHIMPNHPKNLKQRHETRRSQSTDKKIDNCAKS